MTPHRRVNRFTGFISEPSGCFVSQRIRVRVRHTAIQNRGGNGCVRSAVHHARHAPKETSTDPPDDVRTPTHGGTATRQKREPASQPARILASLPRLSAYARRNGRNPARTSRANSSGSSHAAKCPPLSTSLK
ncbi:hypothetical protein DIE06_00395 [Burkholderia sp. Bp8998]|nr:hypothetical protein DIE06_00395 [Burkholderia sp. Bp8998]